MKLIIQRVTKASVTVDNKVIGSINNGYMILVGFKIGDATQQANKLTKKLLNLRIMPDENDQMNKSILDTKGEILLVPQFTLYADTKGRRPGFSHAMPPKDAEKLFNYFVKKVKESSLKIETGIFGAMMDISLINSGPVTIILKENGFKPIQSKNN